MYDTPHFLRRLERIAGAALLLPGAEKPICLPPPNRHHDVIKFMAQVGFSTKQIAEAEQGFITSLDRFVDRKSAWQIAAQTNQIVHTLNSPNGVLFSEHLW